MLRWVLSRKPPTLAGPTSRALGGGDLASMVVFNQRGGYPWEGANRALVNLARALALRCEVILAWRGATDLVEAALARGSPSVQVVPLGRSGTLGGLHGNPSMVLTDDDWVNLRSAARLKRRWKLRTAVYCQVLWGLHAILSCFDLSYEGAFTQALYRGTRLIPFALFSQQYRRSLRPHNFIVANSSYTASLLRCLYGVEANGVIFPPVDTVEFRPLGLGPRSEALVYLGSQGGDTGTVLLQRIVDRIVGGRRPVRFMGNPRLAALALPTVPPELRLGHLRGVTDRELAEVYGGSAFVVCPQVWEMFGYVAAEAVACGIPVLALDSGAFREFITPGMGYLAPSSGELLRRLGEVEGIPLMKAELIHQATEGLLSIPVASERLWNLLGGG